LVKALCEAAVLEEVFLKALDLAVEKVAGLVDQAEQRVRGDLRGGAFEAERVRRVRRVRLV
jgi:hypothetical protein